MTRHDVLSKAIDECMKEFYSIAVPHVEWEDLKEQCKLYSKAYFEWENYKRNEKDNTPLYQKYNEKLDWKGKTITECIGPRPYEFYYLPNEIQKDIADSYVYAYKFDNQQELLDTIEILKNYCKKPIVDKWIKEHTDKDGFVHPGYRSYDHPDNLEKELRKIFDDEILPDICKQYNKQYNLQTTGIESSVSIAYSQRFQNKFFEFLDMAGNFYNWNSELSIFNMNVFMGIAPSTNKEKVIDNWKRYRNKDIEIDEKQMKEDYYGEELD